MNLESGSRKTNGMDLFSYLIFLGLYFCISHSSSKHQLSLSESTDIETDILPSKANLATANSNLVLKWVPGVMLGWWFTGRGDSEKVITDWEHTRNLGTCWIRHNSQVGSAAIATSKDLLHTRVFNMDQIFQDFFLKKL